MTVKSKLPILFAALLLLFTFSMSGSAHAVSAPTDPCADGSSPFSKEDQLLQQNQAAVGQAIAQAKMATVAAFGEVDIATQTCWKNIQNIFSSLAVSGNPMGLITNVIVQQIISMVNQVCSVVLSDLNSIKNFALSQFNRMCLPMPNFNLGLNGFNLKDVTCNGTALFQPGAGNGGPAGVTYDFRSMFGNSGASSQ
ncbi:MAG TPA: hypothetical protein VFR09_01630 [Alphaproteobacteria bacterium]|nr:hypothetical protein [Alphaproteobacteria bacterium]